MNVKLLGLAALAAATLAVQAQAATVVFSDDFDDNDVSDWAFSTNYGGAAGLDTAGILGPYVDAPPGGVDLTARATHTVHVAAGDYDLDLDAFAIVCQGCTVSYDVLFDGVSLTRTAGTNAFQHRTFDLGHLTGGDHLLTLGMHTTNASSGHFLAKFDNVQVSGASDVPEPAAWALMILGFGVVGAAARRRGAQRAPSV